MAFVELKYGRSSISVDLSHSDIELLAEPATWAPLTDAQIGGRFDQPIVSPPIEDLISTGESVLIVVPDGTRQAAAGQITNLLVRRLVANGSAPHEISIIFATGIHRPVTPEEKASILTPFIFQRVKTLDHDLRDLASLVDLGETRGGISIKLNRALVEHDHVVLVAGVTFHYFAGFTGGRKMICPGLASSRTISDTHKLAFDCETLSRREGVGTGVLVGNPVHEAFVEIASNIKNTFSINSIVNDNGDAVAVYCGDLVESHIAACHELAREHVVEIARKRDLVIASCGGWPYDINLIQAHKALESAEEACNEGGTIVLIAQCGDGLGRHDFLDWFSAADSHELARKLCQKYQVNGQTAWSLLRKAERFDIHMITDLDQATCERMRVKKISPDQIGQIARSKRAGYVLRSGAKVLIKSLSR